MAGAGGYMAEPGAVPPTASPMAAGGTPDRFSELQALVGSSRCAIASRTSCATPPTRARTASSSGRRRRARRRRRAARHHYARAKTIGVTLRSGGPALWTGPGRRDPDRCATTGRRADRDDGARVRQAGNCRRPRQPPPRPPRPQVGPDPASLEACTVGGVIANNSGGMRCGDRRRLLDGCASMKRVSPPAR